MRTLALVAVVVCVVIRLDGTSGAPLHGFESQSSRWTHHAAGRWPASFPELSESQRRRDVSDVFAEDSNLCSSLRENEEQRQLLCNDRRSKFNHNPFGLRFGKRYNGYLYKESSTTPRISRSWPVLLFPRELEVPT